MFAYILRSFEAIFKRSCNLLTKKFFHEWDSNQCPQGRIQEFLIRGGGGGGGPNFTQYVETVLQLSCLASTAGNLVRCSRATADLLLGAHQFILSLHVYSIFSINQTMQKFSSFLRVSQGALCSLVPFKKKACVPLFPQFFSTFSLLF